MGCPEDTVYEALTNSCRPNCISNQYWNQEKQRCDCPDDEPYFNGSVCFNCYGDKHYDPDTKTCVNWLNDR